MSGARPKESIKLQDIKIVCLGSERSARAQFCEQAQHESTMSTIGNAFKTITISIDDNRIDIQLWDVPGQVMFRGMQEACLKGANIALIFDQEETWLEKIKPNTTPYVIKIDPKATNACQKTESDQATCFTVKEITPEIVTMILKEIASEHYSKISTSASSSLTPMFSHLSNTAELMSPSHGKV